MKPPAGFGLSAFTTLVKLYADQNHVNITYDVTCNGQTIRFDTRDPILSHAEIVKRYGKTEREIENEAE